MYSIHRKKVWNNTQPTVSPGTGEGLSLISLCTLAFWGKKNNFPLIISKLHFVTQEENKERKKMSKPMD